jgi:predicted DNA-binding transcriptional regulator AlpA
MLALITKNEVARLTSRSWSSINRDEKAGKFPQRVILPSGHVRWRLDEIEAWIDALPRADNSGARNPMAGRQAPIAMAAKGASD